MELSTMSGIFTGLQTGMSMYQNWANQKNAVEAHNKRLKTAVSGAAYALGVTYNSILNQSAEAGMQARRQEFAIRKKGRQMAGQAVAEAAAKGITGRRADLVIKQKTEGEVDRVLGELSADSALAQAALIDRADFEERQTIQKLNAIAADAPADFDILDSILGGGLAIAGGVLKNKERTLYQEYLAKKV
jgi:hypothetical protein